MPLLAVLTSFYLSSPGAHKLSDSPLTFPAGFNPNRQSQSKPNDQALHKKTTFFPFTNSSVTRALVLDVGTKNLIPYSGKEDLNL